MIPSNLAFVPELQGFFDSRKPTLARFETISSRALGSFAVMEGAALPASS